MLLVIDWICLVKSVLRQVDDGMKTEMHAQEVG